MKFAVLLLLSVLINFNFAYSAEILCIFPNPIFSHQTVFRALTEKLLENGHKVTLLSTHASDFEKSHLNVSVVDLSFSIESFEKSINEIIEGESDGNAAFQMVDDQAKMLEQQLSSVGVQRLLNDPTQKFDLLILETNGLSPYHAFADHFNTPVIGISSADAFNAGHEIMGNVASPIAHPDRMLPFTVARSFTERLGSCMVALAMKFLIIPRAATKQEPILKKYFPKITKTYEELVSNVDLQLVNAHPALGYIRPILPNTIQLGFLHIKPPKPLPADLSEILVKSKHGVVYLSFGTVVKSRTMGKNLEIFMAAFADLPYDILWKYDGEAIDKVPSNVHLRKWFPQSDLLAHRNVKLFITHGGQHSIEESIMRHVPMLVCPFVGDQNANAERTAERGISKTLNIHEELDAAQIKMLITEIITSASFKTNVVKLAKLVEDVPLKSPEKALWHIESVIRNRGAKHLNYPQKDIPFYQFHYYDLMLSAVVALVLVFSVIYGVLRFIISLLKRVLNLKSKKD